MTEKVSDKPSPGPRARGRRIAAVLYWAMVAGICLAGAAEVTLQVLFQPEPTAPYRTCHEGLRALFGAVVRARDAAAHTDTGEDAALARFRDALAPAWGYRDGVARLCRGGGRNEGALDAIERLRYAEEHAVRREAGELAPLRRRVQAIVDGELGGLPPAQKTVPFPDRDPGGASPSPRPEGADAPKPRAPEEPPH